MKVGFLFSCQCFQNYNALYITSNKKVHICSVKMFMTLNNSVKQKLGLTVKLSKHQLQQSKLIVLFYLILQQMDIYPTNAMKVGFLSSCQCFQNYNALYITSNKKVHICPVKMFMILNNSLKQELGLTVKLSKHQLQQSKLIVLFYLILQQMDIYPTNAMKVGFLFSCQCFQNYNALYITSNKKVHICSVKMFMTLNNLVKQKLGLTVKLSKHQLQQSKLIVLFYLILQQMDIYPTNAMKVGFLSSCQCFQNYNALYITSNKKVHICPVKMFMILNNSLKQELGLTVKLSKHQLQQSKLIVLFYLIL